MSVANPPITKRASTGPPNDCIVVIFAKAPIPGRCKTRLAKSVGSRRAAHVYRAMLEHAVATMSAQAPGRVILACAPDTRHPLFVRLARRYRVQRYRQVRGDLGTRMAAGIRLGRRHARHVVLMGSDQPALDGDWLRQARRALGQDDRGAWLAPTTDGGYWAIGLSHAPTRIFRGPCWSTPRVISTTRTAMNRLGLVRAELVARNDIDELRDWQCLDRELRRCLSRHATMPGHAGFD